MRQKSFKISFNIFPCLSWIISHFCFIIYECDILVVKKKTFSFTNNAHAGEKWKETGNVVYDFWMIHFRFIEAQSKINNLLLFFRALVLEEKSLFWDFHSFADSSFPPEECWEVSKWLISSSVHCSVVVKNASRLCIDLINVSQF